jgi:hypothetical protein
MVTAVLDPGRTMIRGMVYSLHYAEYIPWHHGGIRRAQRLKITLYALYCGSVTAVQSTHMIGNGR